MLTIKSALICFGKHRKTLNVVARECLKHYSSEAKSSGHSRQKTAILWALGGGVAVSAGLAASLVYSLSPPYKESLVGIQDAGCCEREKWRRRGVFPEAQWRRDVDGLPGLQEAVRMSRELLRRTKDETGSPGIVAAVSVNGTLLWAEGLGYADVENRLPCTSDSVLRVASISKSFTMTAVARLWEEGKLDLDKPIQHYVPEFPKKVVDEEKVDITTRHLVSHLGGIRHYSKDYIKKLGNQSKKDRTTTTADDPKDTKTASKENKNEDATKIKKEPKRKSKLQEFYVTKNYSSVDDALEIFKEDPLMHKPGTKFYYTTHGWTLISTIVAAAADQDFLAYMKTIFKELGMPHTVPDEAHPLIYNRARGYKRNKKGSLVNTPAVNLSHKWAGGGYLSDVRDLIQFGNAMLYSYQYSDKYKDAGLPPGYLKPDTMKAIWSAVPLTTCSWEKDGFYAMGWAVRDKGARKGFCPEKHHLISHTGGAVGASSVLLIVNPNKPVVDATERLQSDSIQDGEVKDGGFRDGQIQINNFDKDDNLSTKDSSSLPQGIAVAIIVNLEDVGLYKTAVEIAEVFQKINYSL